MPAREALPHARGWARDLQGWRSSYYGAVAHVLPTITGGSTDYNSLLLPLGLALKYNARTQEARSL